MCARVTLRARFEEIAEQIKKELGADPAPGFSHEPSFNIAPSMELAAVLDMGGGPVLRGFKWGLVPHWAKDPAPGHKLINARAKTAAEKPFFREAMRRRRCLIIVDGFYEWKRGNNISVPYFIRQRDDSIFYITGLYERQTDKSGQPDKSGGPLTCTLLTTEANDLVQPIHSRMPVLVPPGARGDWLDPAEADVGRINEMMGEFRYQPGMEAYEVSTRVNSPKEDSAECVAPVGA